MKIMANKFDVGDILAQREISIGSETLMPQLHDELALLGAELLLDCINNFNKLIPIKQDDDQASYGEFV